MMIVQIKSGQAGGQLGDLPFSMRVGNAIYSYAMYLAKTFWPTNLVVFYPHPLESLRIWQVALALLLLAAVSWFVWKQRTRHGYGLVGWLWFLGTLVPVIGIIQVGGQGMADRYAYLPCVGIFLMIVWGGADWLEANSLNSAIGAAVAVAALAGLTFVSVRQIGYWESSDDLWQHSAENTQNNFVADEVVGTLLRSEGHPEAVGYFEAAAKSGRTAKFEAHIHNVLGFSYGELGDYAKARENLHLAYSIDPKQMEDMVRQTSATEAASPDAIGYWHLGLLLEGANRISEARYAYGRALQLNPQFDPARATLQGLDAGPS